MLLCLQDHPTQYDPPLWRALAGLERFEVTVWYARGEPPRDPEIERPADWSGVAQARSDTVVARDLLARLRALDTPPQAVLVTGWKRPRTAIALAWAQARRVPVILSSDKTWNEPSPRGALGTAYTLAHAAKTRLFQAAMTPGVLGRQHLVSLGLPPERVVEGLYPIDMTYWTRRAQLLRETGEKIRAAIDSKGPVVLAVCKLSAREDPLFVLECFRQFKKRQPDAHLLQVGDGPLREAYEAHARALCVSSAVTITGYVPYDMLAAYYEASDIFVHLPKREPWGISVLEAMACGCPVVATTTVGAAADLVVPGRTGALGYHGDPESVASSLQLVVDSGVARTGQQARERVQRFDVEVVAKGLADMVQELSVGGGRAAWPVSSIARSELLNVFGRWSP